MKQIRTIKPHAHGGKELPPGSILYLPDRLADWLIEQNVGITDLDHAAYELALPRAVEELKASVPKSIRRMSCCGWSK